MSGVTPSAATGTSAPTTSGASTSSPAPGTPVNDRLSMSTGNDHRDNARAQASADDATGHRPLRERMGDMRSQWEGTVRARPWACIGGAFQLGVMVGRRLTHSH